MRAPAFNVPNVADPQLGRLRISRTTGIVGLVLLLLLVAPLAYILFPGKGGGGGRQQAASSTRPSVRATNTLPAGSPQAVAAAGVEAKTGLKYASSCSGSSACLSITGQTLGQAAAAIDFTTAHSGGRECVGYVVQKAGAWQLLNATCGLPGQLSPMVGRNASVHVPGNCARVRTSPSLGGGVASCLYDGTAVKVTGGPAYADNLMWWQTNRGWIAHDFLFAG